MFYVGTYWETAVSKQNNDLTMDFSGTELLVGGTLRSGLDTGEMDYTMSQLIL